MEPTNANDLIPASARPAAPILFGRPTYKFDSPELVGSIMAELIDPAQNRQAGRQGAPLANALRQLPATMPAARYTAVRGRQLRPFRLDTSAGLANSEIQFAGNFIHFRRNEAGPAGVELRFDDAGGDLIWLPAGGIIAGALFDRLYVTAAVAAGFVTLVIADDPRIDSLWFGQAPV